MHLPNVRYKARGLWRGIPVVGGVVACAALLLCWGITPAAPGSVREPAVAGSWYPGDEETLRQRIDDMLVAAPHRPLGGEVVALVSPHAGYDFSGPTAAAAYRQIGGRSYEAVVVLAPSHKEYFKGASVFDRGAYRTPLGLVPVHEEIAAVIVSKGGDDIVAGISGHRDRIGWEPGEHSLEIQLPFLQRAVENLKIVPIVIGDCDLSACRRIADTIVQAIEGRNCLVVASTDLYHGPSREECRKSDGRTIEKIQAMDSNGLVRGLASGSCQACGGLPTAIAIQVAKKMGANRAEVLARTNSNEVIGKTTDYVVGYVAAAFLRPTGKSEGGLIPKEARHELLAIARESLEHAARGELPPELAVKHSALAAPGAAFVTLERGGRLRGCIGRLLPTEPLGLTVQKMARQAALNDHRFRPVRPDEVLRLHIEISVLTPFEAVTDLESVEVGKHGLFVQQGSNSGLLLPQVPVDFGWDRRTFLKQVCLKAGLPENAWMDESSRFWTFEAEVFGEE